MPNTLSKKTKKTISLPVLLTALTALFSLGLSTAQAAITNPALGPTLGSDATGAKDGSLFVFYIVVIWRGLITVGGLMVIIFFLWGSIEWISAGGDAAKVSKARDRITQSVIGLVLLVSSFAIIGLMSSIFFGSSFNLLNLTFPV